MAAPPRVTIAKPNRPSGVLSVPASTTQKKAGHAAPRQAALSAARLKVVVRRLPPGLSQNEFEEILGPEWKAGGGKVTWASYRAGKVSKDLAKPSRPARAYLHLSQPESIASLSDKVRSCTFVDARGTTKDTCLLGPPSVEFAPYGRIPSGKPRKDARQGTIDQDPEFMSFLESLTNPVVKNSSAEREDELLKNKDKNALTPLVQFIKEKKANKGKEQAAAKAARQQARNEKENKSVDPKNSAQTTSPSSKKGTHAVRVEKAARDAVKMLNKQAANVKGGPAAQAGPKNQTVAPNVAANSAANSALANKQRERGNAKAAAQILQRDLGIGGGRRARGERAGNSSTSSKAVPPAGQTASSTVTASTSTNKPTETSQAAAKDENKPPPAPTSQTTATKPPTGPSANRGPNKPSDTTAVLPPGRRFADVSPTSTQAFLKHANPSQGVTEPLLEEAFKGFGTVKKVEIDKKKGFAYVDFAAPEDLQKAIKASPVKVAQGNVQVLERKTGPQLQAKSNTRGNAHAANNPMPRGGGPPPANNPRGGPAMGNAPFRGGHMNNRGMPAGRGGPVRGRGGFPRGGLHASGPKAGSATSNASTSPAPAAQAPPQAKQTPAEAVGG